MLVYNTREILSTQELSVLVERALLDIAGHIVTPPAPEKTDA